MTDSSTESSLTSKKLSEAIHTITFEINDFVRMRGFYSDLELECMILWKIPDENNGHVTNNLPCQEFKTLLKECVSQNASRIASMTDKKKWIATEDRFYLGGRVRETVLQPNKNSSATWIQKDSIARKILNIPRLPFGMCISLKREKSIPPLEEKLVTETFDKIRSKQRVSIWWKGKPFRTDFTIVHSASSHQEMQTRTSTPIYQIETEFVSDKENLDLCQLSLQEFEKQYMLDSPTLSGKTRNEREDKIASEILFYTLAVINPAKFSSSLSIHRYPDSLYIG